MSVTDVPLDADGKVDVFWLYRAGELEPVERNVALCGSERVGKASTLGQIRAGNYELFPWERKRGKIDPDVVEPLLWEREADKHGRRHVGMTNGLAHSVNEKEWAELQRLGAK